MPRPARPSLLTVALPLALLAAVLSGVEWVRLLGLRAELERFRSGVLRAADAERALGHLEALVRQAPATLTDDPQAGLRLASTAEALTADLAALQARLGPGPRAEGIDVARRELQRHLERGTQLAKRGKPAAARRQLGADLRVLADSRARTHLRGFIPRDSAGLGELGLPLVRASGHWLLGGERVPDLLRHAWQTVLAERTARLAAAVGAAPATAASSGESRARVTALLADLAELRTEAAGALPDQPLAIVGAAARRLAQHPSGAPEDPLGDDALLPAVRALAGAAAARVESHTSRLRRAALGLSAVALLGAVLALAAAVAARRLWTLDFRDPLWQMGEGIRLLRIGRWHDTCLESLRGRRDEVGTLARALEQHAGELSESKRQMERLSNYDGVTGLPNRSLFQERLNRALVFARIGNSPVAVLAIQLDPLAEVTGNLGHDAGDELLHLIAERLTGDLRARDLVSVSPGGKPDIQLSRLGGGEFSVVIPKLRDPQDAGRVTERLLQALQLPLEVRGQSIYVQAAGGIALHPEDGDDVAALLASAHRAARLARDQGPGCFQFFSEDVDSARQRRYRIGVRLRDALVREDLAVHFQPIRHAQTGRVVAAECLLRWEDEELSRVAPAEFIPLAEELGLIESIGEWVLRTACETAREWREAGYAPIRLSVNVSPAQIRQESWVDSVSRILAETGMPPGCLEIEITEGLFLSDPTGSGLDALNDVHAMGVSIALDDFGTGYASLSYLQRFPIHRVKIDRSFVSATSEIAQSKAITRAILAMAQSLGLGTVAEGVETVEQADHARSYGCQELQGLLFGDAVEAKSFLRYLEREKDTEPAA